MKIHFPKLRNPFKVWREIDTTGKVLIIIPVLFFIGYFIYDLIKGNIW